MSTTRVSKTFWIDEGEKLSASCNFVWSEMKRREEKGASSYMVADSIVSSQFAHYHRRSRDCHC